MLMPTKHIKTENALIGVGAEILMILDIAKTASVLFVELQNERRKIILLRFTLIGFC